MFVIIRGEAESKQDKWWKKVKARYWQAHKGKFVFEFLTDCE